MRMASSRGSLSVAIDVTKRKEAQELFQLATEASPSGTLLVDDQGHIVLLNAHIEELFGYNREELIGKPIETLVPERFAGGHPDHRKKFLPGRKLAPWAPAASCLLVAKTAASFLSRSA